MARTITWTEAQGPPVSLHPPTPSLGRMDYRRFLGKVETVVLPYFGGSTVEGPARRLRVGHSPLQPGWWRFEVKGRVATCVAPAEPEGLEAVPRVRGHLWGSRLVREGAVAEPLHLLPEEEPPRFSPAWARRWYDGTLIFESLDFEGEAEESARRALEEGQGLAGTKGVSASLRAACGYALVEAASRGLGIRFAAAEVRRQVWEVAETGRPAAEARLRALEAERQAHRQAVEARLRQLEAQARAEAAQAEAERLRALQEARLEATLAQVRHARPEARRAGPERAERALVSAGARPLDVRHLAAGRLEVTFSFMGERFISVVDGQTLQVVDAGICLAGADREVTLESLPSVIREAIEDGVLVITRH